MSTSSGATPTGTEPTLPFNLGPSLCAVFIAAILYGIFVLQTFFYYSSNGKGDNPVWRILVAIVFAFDTASMALTMGGLYYWTISAWGVPEMLTINSIFFPYEYIFFTLIVFLVQGFYINTVRALRAHWTLVVALFLCSLSALVTGLILPVIQLKIRNLEKLVFNHLNYLAFLIARSSALTCDIGIVVALCYLFTKRRTNVRRANNIVDALIIFAMQRGLVQAAVQIGELVFYKDITKGLPFHVIVSRVYCNSLLVTLNSRKFVQTRGLTERQRRHLELEANPESGDGGSKDSHVTPSEKERTDEQRRQQQQQQAQTGSTVPSVRTMFTSLLSPPFLSTVEGEETQYTQYTPYTRSESFYDRTRTTDLEMSMSQARSMDMDPQSTTQSRSRHGTSLSRDNFRQENPSVSASDSEDPEPGLPPGITTKVHVIGSTVHEDHKKDAKDASVESPLSTKHISRI